MDHGAFTAFEISASGLSAERRRLDAIADNIANAQTTRTAEGGPYKRRQIVSSEAQTAPVFELREGAPSSVALSATEQNHITRPSFSQRPARAGEGGVETAEIRVEGSRLVYEPGHPDADASGMVAYPEISVVQEMIEMILANRAYEANVTSIQSAKAMIQRALEI